MPATDCTGTEGGVAFTTDESIIRILGTDLSRAREVLAQARVNRGASEVRSSMILYNKTCKEPRP